MKPEIVRDWTPRTQRGGIYCSPACGLGCKKEDYDHAVSASDKLCKRLGVGWEPIVWENLGWFYMAKNGIFEIHHHRDGKYSAWFYGVKQFIAEADTPEEALKFLVKEIRVFISLIERQLVTL